MFIFSVRLTFWIPAFAGMTQNLKSTRRSMDRTQACGACNVGSIPTGCTETTFGLYLSIFGLTENLAWARFFCFQKLSLNILRLTKNN